MVHDTAMRAEVLLRRVRDGDAAALGALLERYRAYLGLLVRLQVGRRLQGKVDVEDLLQETFLAAHRASERLRAASEAEFLGWLRSILAAVLANQVRRFLGTRRRDVRLERDLAAELDVSSRALDGALVAPYDSPSQEAARREQGVILADMLTALPEDYREVLILRHLEDLSFPEVAQRMGRTENSVKNLWVRALARLRRSIEEP